MQLKAIDQKGLEQSCRQQIFTLERKLRTTRFKINDIGNYIPGNVMVQDLKLRRNIYMNKSGCDILGHTSEELTALGPDYYTNFFPEEEMSVFLAGILQMHQSQDTDKVYSFFQRVRRSTKDEYKWYFTSCKLIFTSGQEETHKVLNISNEVNKLGKIVKRVNSIVEEKEYTKNNYRHFASLTPREKEILQHLALERNAKEIAEILAISPNTVNSHYSNICNKLQISSFAALTRFASSFGVI